MPEPHGSPHPPDPAASDPGLELQGSRVVGVRGVGVEELVIFRAVVGAGSFTAAAEGLHYTQSAVSRRMANLEAAAGLTLFARQARGVRLTTAGEIVLRHAEDILGRCGALAAELEAVRGGLSGRLRVGAFATANASLVPVALARYREAWPDVAVSMVEALTPALLDEVRAGSLDVAVVSDHPTGALDDSGIALTPLTDDPLLVALPADHALAGGDAVDLADLAEEAWVQGGPDDGSSTLAAAAARAGFRPRIDMAVASWSAKRSLVAAGLGVTLVPALMGPTFLAAGPEVVLRPLSDDALRPRHVAAALPAVTRPLPAARQFLHELHQAVAATPWPS